MEYTKNLCESISRKFSPNKFLTISSLLDFFQNISQENVESRAGKYYSKLLVNFNQIGSYFCVNENEEKWDSIFVNNSQIKSSYQLVKQIVQTNREISLNCKKPTSDALIFISIVPSFGNNEIYSFNETDQHVQFKVNPKIIGKGAIVMCDFVSIKDEDNYQPWMRTDFILINEGRYEISAETFQQSKQMQFRTNTRVDRLKEAKVKRKETKSYSIMKFFNLEKAKFHTLIVILTIFSTIITCVVIVIFKICSKIDSSSPAIDEHYYDYVKDVDIPRPTIEPANYVQFNRFVEPYAWTDLNIDKRGSFESILTFT